jgi:hypothetical protein
MVRGWIALAATVLGCGGSDGGDENLAESGEELQAASRHNLPIRSHFAVDVGLAKPGQPLLDREGGPLGPFVVDAYGPGRKVRVTGNEIVRRSGHEALYYIWGEGSQESGFIPRHYLTEAPKLIEDAGGNGEEAPSNCRSYFVRPRMIPSDLRFERHDGKAPSTLETYGEPGAPAFGGYTTLQWNVVTVDGGGIVRSVMRDGEVFYGTKVARIRVPSVAAPGSVTFMYGFAFQSGARVYGWTVVNHVAGGVSTNHLELRGTNDC